MNKTHFSPKQLERQLQLDFSPEKIKMSCEICFINYDHSIHKPYMLSCPHTFCLYCINKLFSNKCPTCSMSITSKNPNIAMLEFIKESTYDKLKTDTQKTLNKINEITKAVADKHESKLSDYLNKLSDYLNKLSATKEHVKSETNKFISLVKASEAKLIEEVTELEKIIRKQLSLPKNEKEMLTKLISSKGSIEKNTLNEHELAQLTKESTLIETKLK